MIGKDLTLQGAGSANTTIVSRISTTTTLRVLANAAVALNDLTVSKGYSGIDNSGILTITASTISNNWSRGGIVNVGILTLRKSIVSNTVEGSGIDNTGRLTIFNSTLKNNGRIGQGNGLVNRNSGVAFITGSSIINNRGSYGGGIHNSSGLLRVTNSTFSGNEAVYGANVFNEGGWVLMQSSTILYNFVRLSLFSMGDGAVFHLQNNIIYRTYAPATERPEDTENRLRRCALRVLCGLCGGD